MTGWLRCWHRFGVDEVLDVPEVAAEDVLEASVECNGLQPVKLVLDWFRLDWNGLCRLFCCCNSLCFPRFPFSRLHVFVAVVNFSEE